MPDDQNQRIGSGESTLKLMIQGQLKVFKATGEELFGAMLFRDMNGGLMDILVKAGVASFANVIVFVNESNPVQVQVTCVLENGDLIYRERFARETMLSFKQLESLVQTGMALQGIGDTSTTVAFRRAATFGTVRASDLVFKPSRVHVDRAVPDWMYFQRSTR
jgi:hypothetical protein